MAPQLLHVLWLAAALTLLASRGEIIRLLLARLSFLLHQVSFCSWLGGIVGGVVEFRKNVHLSQIEG